MKTHEIKTYTFDELPTEKAKDKARDWYRGDNGGDWNSEYTIEDATAVFALMGFEINKVYFTGFWSQGDGACFEGTWRAKDAGGALAKVKEYAPQDEVLHRLAGEFERIANLFPNTYLKVEHRGHYYHEHCTDFTIDIHDDDGIEIEWTAARESAEKDLIEVTKDAMRWIYSQLEKDYDHNQTNEVVDKMLCENEYEFTEDGARFKY